MAATSLAEKTRLPHLFFNRAMMSGLTSLGGWTDPGGTRRANNFPDLVISTGSPSAIHAATRGKRFRKSRTVAVFIVIQICITGPELSTLSDYVGGYRAHLATTTIGRTEPIPGKCHGSQTEQIAEAHQRCEESRPTARELANPTVVVARCARYWGFGQNRLDKGGGRDIMRACR